MKPFASGDKLGTPAKKRSRSISTRKHEVGQRISVLSTNTYLRTLSIAVGSFQNREKRNCRIQSLVSHKYPHPRATCMLFCTCFDTSYRLKKFRVIIRISNNCKQRERHVAEVPMLCCCPCPLCVFDSLAALCSLLFCARAPPAIHHSSLTTRHRHRHPSLFRIQRR